MPETISIKKLSELISYLPVANHQAILKAADFSQRAHQSQKRKSGEPYFFHPLATAIILAQLKVDASTIMAGLLHDVIEDTATPREKIIQQFGQTVYDLVEGVTKVGHIRLKTNTGSGEQNSKYLESLRKLFLAMARDYRVVLIKLADRLHNLRTLKFIPAPKQTRIATETLEIYVPLANRLGLWPIKSELEDHCFQFLQPEEYKQLCRQVKNLSAREKNFIQGTIQTIKSELEKNRIKYRSVTGRTKNLYSIYLKTIHKNRAVDEIFDIYAIRIIVGSIKDCYTVLGIIHNRWRPIPGRFKDYISVPKTNGYQSLHTSVFTPSGQKVEIQIRTPAMHQHAEKGIAAHWLYKEKKSLRDYEWLKDLENLKDVDLPELSRQLKIDIFEDRIFVYTPQGDVIDLPQNSTPVDFAFHIHSELGHKLVGAKANHKIVPLDYKINNGDILEILTAKNSSGPKREWLEFTKTNNAKSKIRSFLKKQNYHDNLASGEKIIQQEIERLNLAPLAKVTEKNRRQLLTDLPYKKIEDVMVAISTGDLSVKKVIKYLYPESEILPPEKHQKNQPVSTKSNSVIFSQNQYLNYKLASTCCSPRPPRFIIGYITRGQGITVHLLSCKNILNKDSRRLIPAHWEKVKNKHAVDLIISCIDQVGMLHKITGVIARESINLEGIETQQGEKNYAKIKITVGINNFDELSALIDQLARLPGIKNIQRIKSK